MKNTINRLAHSKANTTNNSSNNNNKTLYSPICLDQHRLTKTNNSKHKTD